MKSLSVSEYGLIRRGLSNQVLSDGNIQIDQDDFSSLMSLLDERAGQGDTKPIFTICRVGGVDCLKVQNWVGVVRTSNGTQIEILPKLARAFDTDASRDLLVKMLIELRDSPFKEGTVASLQAHKMPLFELLLSYFLEQVVAIVRKGIARTYVSQSDNLHFLRGKLQITEHLKRNLVGSAKIYCDYDEYEADRPINRLIRGALDITLSVTRDSSNQQRCRELLYWFDTVPATSAPELDFRRVQRDRLIQHYEPAMPVCRLILSRLNPLTKEGERSAVSMLFPMERVFEDYVAAKLPRQFPNWGIQSQVDRRYLVERHAGSTKFKLVPDLELRKKNSPVRVIADTKWKLLDELARSSNYNVSQADMYQLYAYLRKYLSDQKEREVFLIYPLSESFRQPLPAFYFQEPNERLWVVPYDLERDELCVPDECLLENDYRLERAV